MSIDIKQKLLAVIKFQQEGKLPEAEQTCRQILAIIPHQADALHFLGLINKQNKNYQSAEEFFRKSIEANAKQPAVLNNFANLLMAMEKCDEAGKLYKQATNIEPGYADAWFNWAVMLIDQNKFSSAEKKLKKAIKLKPDDPRYHNAMGLSYAGLQKNDKAIAEYEKAIEINPDYLKAIHNLGAVYSTEKLFPEAKTCFMHVIKKKPQQSESWQSIASVFLQDGDIDEAIYSYSEIVKLDPLHIESHNCLNNLLWQRNDRTLFLQSYVDAMKLKPDAVALPVNYVDMLTYAGYVDKAFEVLADAKKRLPNAPEIDHSYANLYKLCGDLDKTAESYEACASHAHGDTEFHIDFAEFLIEQGDVERSLYQLEKAEARAPDHQKMWGLRGICWGIMGDEREAWLNDFDNYIKGFELEVPEGYASMDEFNEAYREILNDMHKMVSQPLDQTLNGGTQTIGGLYTRSNPVIQKLRKSVLKAAGEYFDGLPDDPTHPVIRRMTGKIKISGSWSVKLRGEGYHTNHVHPAGFVSGPYYIYLPDEVKHPKDENDKQGWVTFGAHTLGVNGGQDPRIIIQPQEGLQVFFPSYVWHGTIPFQSDDYRLTSPCDLMPA